MNATEQTLKYKILRLNDDNIPDAEKLHAAVYGVKPRPGFFAAKYDTAFTGIKHAGFIAYHKNMPISFYAVIPCFICTKDGDILAAQSSDTMTHPDFRYKGLFVELATRTFDLCRSLGINLVFGFPNQNSLPGFINKLGWQTTERMDCFRMPVPVKQLSKVTARVPLLKKIVETNRANALKKTAINQLCVANSVFDNGFAGVCRDHSFASYKTYNKTYVIRIANSRIWLKINTVLLIGDMTVTENEFEITMHGLQKLASRLGQNEIQFHACAGTALHRLFSTVCQPISSFPVIFKSLGANFPTEPIKFTSADIDTF